MPSLQPYVPRCASPSRAPTPASAGWGTSTTCARRCPTACASSCTNGCSSTPSGTRCAVRAPRAPRPHTRGLQPAACSLRPVACSLQPATYGLQLATHGCTCTHAPPAHRPPIAHQGCRCATTTSAVPGLPDCLTRAPPGVASRCARGVEARRGGAARLQVAREGASSLLRRHVRQGRRAVVEVSAHGRAAAGARDAQGGRLPPYATMTRPPLPLACPSPPTAAARARA